ALQRAGLTLDYIDLIEVNEAFAAQYLSVEKELGLDREKVNVNGGAIALGHPLGVTGTRPLLTLPLALGARGGAWGAVGASRRWWRRVDSSRDSGRGARGSEQVRTPTESRTPNPEP